MKEAPLIKKPFRFFDNEPIDDPIGMQSKLFNSLGDIYRKKMFETSTFFMGHPIYAQSILLDHKDNYFCRSHLLNDAFSPLLDKNSLFLTGDLEKWYKDRLIAKITFDEQLYFQDYAKTIISVTDQTLAQWDQHCDQQQLFDVKHAISKLVVDNVVHTLFIHFDLLNSEVFAKSLPTFMNLTKHKLRHTIKPLWSLSASKRKHQLEAHNLRSLVAELIRERLKQGKQWDDLLGNFLHEYSHLSEELLIDTLAAQIITFLFLGFVPPAGLIHWILVVLSLHPYVEREMLEELNRVVGSRLPEYGDLTSLSYFSSVIREVMRLHPIAHEIHRQSLHRDEINGYNIPANAEIILCIHRLHRHPDFWKNPDGFDPERFLTNPLGQDNRFAYIPFGAGERACIGSAFAMMEATLITAMILQRFQLSLSPQSDVQPCTTSLETNCPSVHHMSIERRA